MDKKYKELGVNTVIFAGTLLLSKLVLSLLIPVYTRTLSTEQYGIADLVTTICGFVVPICSLSIHESVFRFSIDDNNDKKQILRCGINISWIAIAFICIVGCLLQFYNPVSDWMIYLIFISIFTMLRNILSLYTKADNRILLFGFDTIVCNFVLGITNIIFLVCFHFELAGYFLAIIISLFVSIIFLCITEKITLLPKHKKGDCIVTLRMIKYSAPLVANSISWIFMSLIDRLMLTSLYTSNSNGIYAISSKIPTLVTVIASVFNQAWGISIVKDYDNCKDESFYSNVYGFFSLMIFFSTSVILLFTNNVLKMIIGAEFSESVRYVGVLMIGTVFLAYSSFFSSVYSAAKKSSKIAISSIGGTLLNIVLNVVLIPWTGIMGACIATSCSYVLITIYRMIDCRKYINISFDIFKFIICVALLLIQCVFVTIAFFDVFISFFTCIGILFIYRKDVSRIIYMIAGKMSAIRAKTEVESNDK